LDGYESNVLLIGLGGPLPISRASNKITMSKIGTYIKESYKELTTKVTWPTWSKLQSSAILVMVASLICAAVVWLMDFVFRTIMTGIYQL
jgi:preprotein translocase subunit SecE